MGLKVLRVFFCLAVACKVQSASPVRTRDWGSLLFRAGRLELRARLFSRSYGTAHFFGEITTVIIRAAGLAIILGVQKVTAMNVFETSAAELEKLNKRVHELWRHRSEGPEATAAWREAARTFHANYDRLAFPGGLVREIKRLKNGDLEAIELAVRYLEVNPWYFRSGYHKADFLRLLKRQPLTDGQCARLRKIILDRVRGRPVREMRGYGHLAPRINNPQFEEDLAAIKESSNRQASNNAAFVLQLLRSAKKSSSGGRLPRENRTE